MYIDVLRAFKGLDIGYNHVRPGNSSRGLQAAAGKTLS